MDSRELEKKSLKGGAYTIGARLFRIFSKLFSIVITARFLFPEDFAVIAMVASVSALAFVFQDMGLTPAAIQRKELSHNLHSVFHWLNVLIGLILMILMSAVSPLIALFYGRDELVPVIMVMSTSFLIGNYGAQYRASLLRQMNFSKVALVEIISSFVSVLSTVILAVVLQSYWALVVGNISLVLVSTILHVKFAALKPLPFWKCKKEESLRKILGFGAGVTVFDLVNYLHRNLDNILIGRIWGDVILGYYSRGYSLLMMPIQAIRGPVLSVAMPVLSKLQDSPNQLKVYYKKVTFITALLTMPLMSYLFIAAEPVVILFLGERWSPVIPIFSILALSGVVQPSSSLAESLMLAIGKPRQLAYWGIINTIVVSTAFIIGVKWGAEGVAAGYAVATYLLLLPFLKYAFKGSEVTVKDYMSAVSLPICASAGAAIVSSLLFYYTKLSEQIPILQICLSLFVFLAVFATIFSTSKNGRSTFVKMGSAIRNRSLESFILEENETGNNG